MIREAFFIPDLASTENLLLKKVFKHERNIVSQCDSINCLKMRHELMCGKSAKGFEMTRRNNRETRLYVQTSNKLPELDEVRTSLREMQEELVYELEAVRASCLPT